MMALYLVVAHNAARAVNPLVLFMQVLQSLDFMHSLGLIHADLKPENILIKSYSR